MRDLPRSAGRLVQQNRPGPDLTHRARSRLPRAGQKQTAPNRVNNRFEDVPVGIRMRARGFYHIRNRAIAARTMRSGWGKITGVVAIYAIALHVILAALVPVGAFGATIDPLSVICHSAPAGQKDQGQSVPAPSQACEHCNLCSTLAPPPAPETPLVGNLRPAPVLLVLIPLSTATHTSLAANPKLARGPPQAM